MIEHDISSSDASYDIVISELELGGMGSNTKKTRVHLWRISCKNCGASKQTAGDSVEAARVMAWHSFLRHFPWDCRESLIQVTMSR
jgi:hypothetical protein